MSEKIARTDSTVWSAICAPKMISLNIHIESPDLQTDDGQDKVHHTGGEHSLRAPCWAMGTR